MTAGPARAAESISDEPGADAAAATGPGTPDAGSVAGAPVPAGPEWTLAPQPSSWQVLSAQFQAPPGLPAGPQPAPLGAPAAQLTLRQAVAAALQNNPGLIAQSLTPVIQEQGILQAQAVFDPLAGAETNYDHLVTPATSALSGAEKLDNSNFNWNFYTSKTFWSGAKFRIDFLNNRFKTNSEFQGLIPQYKPVANITLNQPLLRDFGLYFTRLRIQIAETATDAAVEDYRAAVANFIQRVVQSYWAVVLSSEQLRVKQDSLSLAQQTVSDNRTRVDVGVLPPVAIKESEAEAARRQEEVIVAENALFQARRVLQQLVYVPGYNEWLPRPVEPIDRPSTERIIANPEQALQTALDERSEIRAARLNVKANELNVAVNKNQLLPRLDLFGIYGVNALSGDPTRNSDPLAFQSIYGGTYGDALGRLVSNNFYEYGGGIKLEVPIGNAAAEAQFRQSRVQAQQAQGNYRQRVSDVLLEVGQAFGDVQSNAQRIEATRVARELAEENLHNQQRRYDVGVVTTTDLLRFQNEVTNARLNENLALIDYNTSIVALSRAEGTLLKRFNVEIEPRNPTYTPWWARF